MRRMALSLAMIMILVLPMTAYAATSRYIRIYPFLSFDIITMGLLLLPVNVDIKIHLVGLNKFENQ